MFFLKVKIILGYLFQIVDEKVTINLYIVQSILPVNARFLVPLTVSLGVKSF